MRPTLALASIDRASLAHRHGHRCDDGQWYNPNTGTKTPCPITASLTIAATQIQRLHAQVHDASHNPTVVDLVAEAMLAGTPLADLPPENADGWRHLTRLAIEALAEYLDRDPVLEARAAAAVERIGG